MFRCWGNTMPHFICNPPNNKVILYCTAPYCTVLTVLYCVEQNESWEHKLHHNYADVNNSSPIYSNGTQAKTHVQKQKLMYKGNVLFLRPPNNSDKTSDGVGGVGVDERGVVGESSLGYYLYCDTLIFFFTHMHTRTQAQSMRYNICDRWPYLPKWVPWILYAA